MKQQQNGKGIMTGEEGFLVCKRWSVFYRCTSSESGALSLAGKR